MSVTAERSVTYSKENQEKIMEGIEMLIEDLAAAYDTIKAVESHTLPINTKIQSINFLPGYTSKDSEEEIGSKLVENIDQIVKSVGDEFKYIIDNNFILESFKKINLSKRIKLDEEMNIYIADAENILIVPDRNIIEFEIAAEIETEIENMKSTMVIPAISEKAVIKEMKEQIAAKEIEINNEVKSKHNLRYIASYKKYTEYTEKKNLAINIIRKLKSNKDRITILDTILTAYINAKLQIVSKIKTTLTAYPLIARQLSSTVTVRATGEDINDPFGNNCLTGIIECLHEKYKKKTFVTFTNSLIDVMSFSMSAEQTENTPWVSFEEMEATMSSWKKKELFKFMTEDQFFSAAFLKGMHPNSKFRKDLINETTKHIRSLSDLVESSSDERMPIFKFIKEYVRVEQENRKFASVTKINDKLKRSFESQWNNKKENNTENAAVAFSAVNNGKMFSGEILSTDKISFEDNKGKKHCYAAVKKQSSLCAKCYPESGIATNPCSRKCFGQKCNLCGFYGHISYYCMQSTHAITGSSVQHN